MELESEKAGNPFPVGVALFSGVLGKAGKDSSRDAPNEDEGLKALIPPNPVEWVCTVGDTVIDGDVDVTVAPVPCDDNEDENIDPENADPAVVDAVL